MLRGARNDPTNKTREFLENFSFDFHDKMSSSYSGYSFHDGEVFVQQKVGVRSEAEDLANMSECDKIYIKPP